MLSTRASSNSREEPLMAGPMGPSLDGSLLWQATQFAKNTDLPLFTSRFVSEFAPSSSLQAVIINKLKPNQIINLFTCRIPRHVIIMSSGWRLYRRRRPPMLHGSDYKLLA